ncbi:glycoside hydrolase family 36 N-terminal domain-containing protein [Gracilibacillus sp. JCM 18860]|uniref:glycoside hydrolase family 36 N-terminal domain-containing protein n=1 Tax=Gracilibacillus sp. JCM 18860 TaxID=1306159 RepID=UPI003261A5B8
MYKGAWAREGHLEKKRLSKGIQSIYSNRGASSHVFNPFLALKRFQTDEQKGRYMALVLYIVGIFWHR